MSSVYRVTALWTGFTGAPGYSRFSFSDLTTDAARNSAGVAVKAFFTGIQNTLDNNWTISFPPEVIELDAQTGVLIGATDMTTAQSSMTGGVDITAWVAGSGYVVTWGTGAIMDGRRVKGRTFIVPAGACFEADGTLTPTAINNATTAGAGLINNVGNTFAIWHRRMSKPTTPGEKPVQIGGDVTPVTSCLVKDMPSQLRSRRT